MKLDIQPTCTREMGGGEVCGGDVVDPGFAAKMKNKEYQCEFCKTKFTIESQTVPVSDSVAEIKIYLRRK